MPIHTKIVCTIGPASEKIETLNQMIDAGMNVARLNFSHGTQDEHRLRIERLKEARRAKEKPLAIMLDTKGPEIRVGKLNNPIEVKKGAIFTLIAGDEKEGCIPVRPPEILKSMKQGMIVLFDDGYVASRVVEIRSDGVMVEMLCDGAIGSRKGINVPGAEFEMPLVTDQDRDDIASGVEEGVDLVAASFVNTPDQIFEIKRLLPPNIQVIAKIETAKGVENFDAILQVSDGIMIARGDLGVELPLSKVPSLQKMMIRKCHEAGKPSIVATQMLETMMVSPRPTRAEASDVANGIYDSASAVMLSGETAAGRFPVKSVETMRQIIEAAEEDFDYEAFFFHSRILRYRDVPSAVSVASLRTAISAGATAIFVATSRGRTARLISRLRPSVPVIALTDSEKSYHQMAFNWGLIPVYAPDIRSTKEAFHTLSDWSENHNLVERGDIVVLTAGVPFGVSGTTNMMIVESIGDVLLRGHEGLGTKLTGSLHIVLDPGEPQPADIYVITSCSQIHEPLLKQAKGIILQNHADDIQSQHYLMERAKELNLSILTGADGATSILEEGQEVTLDPKRRVVFRQGRDE